MKNSLADFSRHGFVISHGGTSGNVFYQCEDRQTQRATGSTGSYVTGGSGSDNHMFFSHSNLWDRCHAHNSFWTAHHRTFSGTIPHGVTSTQAVYWNTTGSGTRYTDIVRSEQLHYGYIIGTSGSRSGATNPTGGNTAPADHLEGIGSGATLSPQSLYLDQLSRRHQPTVIYQGNGATAGTAPVDASSPYQPGDTVTVLDAGNLVKPGFIFTGWNTAPDGSGANQAAGSTFEITGSTIFYAQWLGQPYSVTFNANGGTPTDPVSTVVEFGTPYGPLPATSRPGFSFAGWFTSLTGGNLVTPPTLVTLSEDHTLYARWSAPPVVDAGPDQTVAMSGLTLWTPAQISAAAWYDAADASSISASSGAVSQWNDKSGNHNHLSQGEPTRQPTTGTSAINGHNVLDFSDDYIFTSSGLGADIRSVFMVTANHVAITSSTPPIILLSTAGDGISTGDGYGASTGAFVGEVLSVFDENTTSLSKRQAASSATLPLIDVGTHLHTYALATDWFIGFDGSDDLRDLTSGTSRNPMLFADSFSLGAGARHHPSLVEFFYDGSVAEVVLLAATVSQEDRQIIEGYLAHKWGMTEKLPAEHPHKGGAPESVSAVAALDGTASDPENDPLAHTWSVVSGPGPVIFTNASMLNTNATFTVVGEYTLRLTSDDGFGSSYDELVMTVGDLAPTTPTINAWPTATVIVEGQALSAATLSGGSAAVPGSFSYNDPSIIPGAGSYPAGVTFAPDDTAAYLTVAGTVAVTVLTAFEDWAGGGDVTFTGDANGDGVADGLAWLLGAAAPPDNANALLPTAVENTGALEANFRMLKQANRGTAVMKLQYGTDLGTWATITIPEESGTHDGVDFVITPNGEFNEVEATISASAAGTGGGIFIRLSGDPGSANRSTAEIADLIQTIPGGNL